MKTMFSSKPKCVLLGLGLMLAGAVTGMAQNKVTFQIDMTSQPGAADVFVRGSFNNWGGPDSPALVNNGTGIFTNTFDIADSPGTVEACKVFYNPGGNWEGDPNRQFVLAGGDQVLPLSAWNDKYPSPTNNVTFRVDMSAQLFLGNFTPGQTMRVAGDFTGWGDGADLTNNPALSGNASNVYSKTLPVAGFPGGGASYKFRANGGWENPASTGGNNRTLTLAGGDQVLPLVFYDDSSPCDLLSQTNFVTFKVDMTNVVTTDGLIVFDGSQSLFVNGDWIPWWSWTDPFIDRSAYTLTNIPGTSIYSVTVAISTGKSVGLTYKYGVQNPGDPTISRDNEAGFGTNHVRYIRGQGSYTMPTDKFGVMLLEPSFGNLKASASGSGSVSVSWLGRQCVTLQTKTNLTSGSWVDHPATEGMSSTNWPVGGGNLYFRLVKP